MPLINGKIVLTFLFTVVFVPDTSVYPPSLGLSLNGITLAPLYANSDKFPALLKNEGQPFFKKFIPYESNGDTINLTIIFLFSIDGSYLFLNSKTFSKLLLFQLKGFSKNQFINRSLIPKCIILSLLNNSKGPRFTKLRLFKLLFEFFPL